jgi:hypothetical protein
VRQVELLGFSETEEMRECRKAHEKLTAFLMVYFDRSWRQLANDAKPAVRPSSAAAQPQPYSLRSQSDQRLLVSSTNGY